MSDPSCGSKMFSFNACACTCERVGGFAGGMKQTTECESTWIITLSGSKVRNCKLVEIQTQVVFVEFQDLGEPFIIGMPFIDTHGGLETTLHTIWLGGLYIPRYFADKKSGEVNGIVNAMSPEIWAQWTLQIHSLGCLT